MSAAVIVDTFPRWSERFIARELNELKRRGVAFTIYCLRAGDSDLERDPEFADLMPLRAVLPSCFLPSFARNLGMDAEAKERLAVVENELGLTAFRQIGCADSLTKLIRDDGHHIVYAHFASLPLTLGWLAATALKLPLVLSVHARDVFVDAQLLKEKLAYARKVFVCNCKAHQRLIDIACDDSDHSKIVLMPHGLPLEKYGYVLRRQRSALGKSLNLLAAGRFVPKKGFDILLDALATPELADVRVELTLLGEGPERKALEKKVVKLGLGDRVRLPGVVLDSALNSHFDAADAFVMPSVASQDGDSDGLPNVVIEAFATGLPVIGTEAGSLGDVLTERTGFIAEGEYGRGALKDTTARNLALAIREVLLNPESARDRAERARAAIEERYDIRKNIEPLVRELT